MSSPAKNAATVRHALLLDEEFAGANVGPLAALDALLSDFEYVMEANHRLNEERKAAEADRDEYITIAEGLEAKLKAAEAERDPAKDERAEWMTHYQGMVDDLAAERDRLIEENKILRTTSGWERLAQTEEALFNHGYGTKLCRCEWCAALAGEDTDA